MHVNTQPGQLDTAAPELPPELRHDGAGSRTVDVLIAIMAAHRAGAFAGSVTTVVHPTHHDLKVHLYEWQGSSQLARAAAADHVLREFNIPADQIERTELFSDAWCHSGVTDDGLLVQVFAAGPVTP